MHRKVVRIFPRGYCEFGSQKKVLYPDYRQIEFG